ncbi:MAG: Ig-like domain-containing protein [Pseudomonadota bacterium]|nr:Ig-like domain-containing protein [Pseudomonadota bacterium]
MSKVVGISQPVVVNPGSTVPLALDITGLTAGQAVQAGVNQMLLEMQQVGALVVDAHSFTVNFTPSGDITPPKVSVDFPSNGTIVRGTTAVTAIATDDVGVARVDFYLDGTLKATDTTSAYSFVWDTTGGSDGPHTILAKAYDGAGNSASHSISVIVDNTPPVVIIQRPLEGATVSGTIEVSGTATDSSGIWWIELYVDGRSASSQLIKPAATSLSWKFSYNTGLVTNGEHTLKVVAKDVVGFGNEGSRSVAVAVSN